MTNGQPIISIRGLRKTYHVGEVDVHALRGVDLDVQPGEFVSVVGPSGSGKSTLFHIVGGLTPPTSGTIHIGGRDLLGMSEAERTELRKTSVGFVFQKYNLLPTLTARDNIEIARDIAHKNGPLDPEFLEVLKLLGIESRWITSHAPSPAASSSASPLPAPSSIVQPFCWPMNPPGISTRRIRTPCWPCCAI